MPTLFATPLVHAQLLSGYATVCYVESDGGTYYAKSREEWTGGGWREETVADPYKAFIPPPFQMCEIDVTMGGSMTGTSTVTLSEEIDTETVLATALADLNSLPLTWDDATDAFTNEFARLTVDTTDLAARFCRYRFEVPDSHTGSFFKFTWDVVFFPAGGGSPVAIDINSTWQWAGPGDSEDPDSWVSPWYYLPKLTDPGEIRVVNVRYESYRSSRLGNKPQITGEGVDLP